MVRVVLISVILGLAACQNNERDAAVNRLFSTAKPTFDELYEEKTEKPPESFGAIQKCGEGTDRGVRVCVPYYRCDGTTNTVIPDSEKPDEHKATDGAGLIDVRFGANSCQHYLDVCCKVGDGNVPNPSDNDNRNPATDVPVPNPFPDTTSTTPSSPPVSLGCGVRNTNGVDFKITGNYDNEAEYGEFPWMVAILRSNYNPSVDKNLAICGGSLIGPNVILTGAHCVYNYKINDLIVRAGEWDTQTEKERLPYQERRVAKIILHQDFHPKTVVNDVALLILESPFKYQEHIAPVCLPQSSEILNSGRCFVTGWGKDIFGQEGRYSAILKKIELPIVPFDQCQSLLRTTRLGSHFQLHNSFMCAGGEAGKDACTGDGGSPLVCPDPGNPRRYIQVGIVAWGIGCGEEKIPGVYANVAKFRNWIDENLQQLNIGSSSYTN